MKMLAQAAARRALFTSNGQAMRALALRSAMRTRAVTTATGRAGDAVATPAPEYTPKYVPGGRTYPSSVTPFS